MPDIHHAINIAASADTIWGGLMFRIKGAAEGKRPGPLFQKNALVY